MDPHRAEPPPHHAECLPLAPVARTGVWAVTAALVVPGLVLSVRPAATASPAVAGILLTLGAGAAFAARRLAAHETVLTRISLRAGFGPLSRAFPRHDLEVVGPSPARGWRRLYARQELLLRLRGADASRLIALPSNDPEALALALAPPSLERSPGGPYP